MNSTRRVFIFVISSVFIYLFFSFFSLVFGFEWAPLKRVNLISDLIEVDTFSIAKADSNESAGPVVADEKNIQNFQLYNRSHFITSFNSDTTRPSLNNFIKKLHEHKVGLIKRKIRIAYFGDSMIEGDLLTQTFRKLLQKEFGGTGVGYVPITSQVSKFRQTAYTKHSNTWQDENFRTEGNKSTLFLSGYQFSSSNGWIEIKDQVVNDSIGVLEKSLLCGYMPSPVAIGVNSKTLVISPIKKFNRIVVGKDRSPSIKISIENDQLPIYGLSFESESGVIVDNYSFRGISGIEFNKIDSLFLKAIEESNSYDLIIFQYGVNLLFRPNEKNFNWYGRALLPVVKKLKSCFFNADFLVVSTADRAFRYGTEYKSAIGIDSLIKIQAQIAYETKSCFYNQFETMGGRNSIVDWATRNPSLANKDYVHPNHRGAEILGQFFFEAVMNDYEKYISTTK